jgi:hypothetical protein
MDLYSINVFMAYLWAWYLQIVYFFMNSKNQQIKKEIEKEAKKEEIVLNPTESYMESKKVRFLQSYLEPTNQTKLNSNIDPVFYSKTDLQQILEDSNNNIEPTWKRRVLYETTPRGNIVMFYDSYKQGFSYYSDVNSIPYSLLNAVAMKYVMVFYCRDFFVDDQVTPVESPSPLVQIYLSAPEKEVASKSTNDLKDAPFAKFKNYNKESKTSSNDASLKNKKEYNNNRFIALGKISNFNFIQPVSNKICSPVNGFSSKLLDNLSGETQLQKQVMNYIEYKTRTSKNIKIA